MLRVLFRSQGHDVHEAADGQAGVELAASLAPDVALVDVGLPALDGYEVARRIRAGKGGALVRLIAITGYGQAEDRTRALEAGFDAHLTKPVTPEALAERLGSALAGPRARWQPTAARGSPIGKTNRCPPTKRLPRRQGTCAGCPHVLPARPTSPSTRCVLSR